MVTNYYLFMNTQRRDILERRLCRYYVILCWMRNLFAVPTLFQLRTMCFVVDLSTLKDRDDICADDLGAWKYTGSRVSTFSVKFSEMGCHVVNPNSKGAVVINVR